MGLLDLLPDKIVAVIGPTPSGSEIVIDKNSIHELVSEASKQGKYVWIPACSACKGVVIEGSYRVLLAHLDYFIAPSPRIYEMLDMNKEAFRRLYEAYQESLIDIQLIQGPNEKGYLVAILVEGRNEALELLKHIALALNNVTFHDPTRPVIPLRPGVIP